MMDFASMIWLFSSNKLSRGLCRMNIAEAATLWQYAKRAAVGILEVGRFNGGSTCLLAAANPNVPLTSIDLHPCQTQLCCDYLSAMPNVSLVEADSRTYRPSCRFDLALIDGDHSYDGVRADWQNLRDVLTDDAVIAFHDAVPGAVGTQDGPRQLTEELLASGEVVRLDAVDSLLFVRRCQS